MHFRGKLIIITLASEFHRVARHGDTIDQIRMVYGMSVFVNTGNIAAEALPACSHGTN